MSPLRGFTVSLQVRLWVFVKFVSCCFFLKKKEKKKKRTAPRLHLKKNIFEQKCINISPTQDDKTVCKQNVGQIEKGLFLACLKESRSINMTKTKTWTVWLGSGVTCYLRRSRVGWSGEQLIVGQLCPSGNCL